MNDMGKEEILLAGKNEPEISLPEIDSQLAQLKYFETDLQNDEVAKARIALLRVFDPQFQWFQSQRIIVTYHGSLQYNDPRNLDVDVEFMGNNLGLKDVISKCSEIEDALKKTNAWPRKNCYTNFGVCSINGIRNDLKELEKENYASDFKEDQELNPELVAALILSSKVLYEVQRPQLGILQQETRKLILENPWLRRGVYNTLTDVIVTRQNRRK